MLTFLLLASLAAATSTPTPVPRKRPTVTPTPARRTGPVVLRAPGRRLGGSPDGGYAGEPISLNLTQADLRDVLQTFAKITELNIVIYPEVKGTVTVTLKDIPWDQALELILQSNGYGYVIEGRVMRVGPVSRLVD